MMKKTILERILISKDEWEKNKDQILAQAPIGVDYLMIQIEGEDPWDCYFFTHRVSDLNKGNTKPLYKGEEFPEAICSCEL